MDDNYDPFPIPIVPPKIHSSDKSLKWGRFHLVRALPFQKELERGSAKHEAFLPSFSSALACARRASRCVRPRPLGTLFSQTD